MGWINKIHNVLESSYPTLHGFPSLHTIKKRFKKVNKRAIININRSEEEKSEFLQSGE
jgi:hypothetical protein